MAAPGPGYPTDQKYEAPPPYFEQGQGAMPQPPPAGFVNPGHIHHTTATVITTEPTHVLVTGYAIPRAHESVRIDCPYCRADVTTSVNYDTGMMAHLFALILCVIGCWPCCLIPYCVDGCKDTTHQCPACGRHLGVVKRL